MVSHSNFCVKINSSFSINRAVLYKIYMPIIGIKAVSVYEMLLIECELKLKTNIGINSFTNLAAVLGYDLDVLNNAFKFLEAIGLLERYESNVANNRETTFILKEPLSYESFVNNEDYYALLKNSLSDDDLYLLDYTFLNVAIPINSIKTTTKLDCLFNEWNLSTTPPHDLLFVYEYLAKKTKNQVLLDTAVKETILNLLNQNKLSKSTLFKILDNSISEINGSYCITDLIFKTHLNNYINQENLKEVQRTVKINRNFAIFAYKSNLEDYQKIIDDYLRFDSETYYSVCTLSSINNNLQKLLKSLRSKYNMPDAFINVLIDYCLYKNTGKFSDKYIKCIAQTVYKAGFAKIENIIEYLQYVSANKVNEFMDRNSFQFNEYFSFSDGEENSDFKFE